MRMQQRLPVLAMMILALAACGRPPSAASPTPDAAPPTLVAGSEAALLATMSAAPAPQQPTPAAPTPFRCEIAAPEPAQQQTHEALVKLFDYDPGAPLELQEERSAQVSDGIAVHDLSYASPKGGRVPAYLVVPDGPGPFAGLLMLPGLSEDRSRLLPYAKDLAKTGAVILLIDMPSTRTERLRRESEPVTFTPQDRDEQIQLIVDLRRGVDLLTARADVDTGRLGYIGVGYGAAMGGLLAGVEKRIKAYVLAGGDGGLVAHFTGPDDQSGPFQRLPKEQQECWLAAMAPIEPIRYVGYAAPVALFFQSIRQDDNIPEEDARRFQQAGSEPKRIEWYDTWRDLDEQGVQDHVDWLQTQIGIDATKFAPKR